LEENLINVERVEFVGTVAIDGLPNAGDKFSQLCVVVVRDHRARRSSLRLAGHEYEATQASGLAAACADIVRRVLAGHGTKVGSGLEGPDPFR
jgi:hypothetical protein